MQKKLLISITSQRGSALVGIVALSIVMAIAGAGFITMTGNTVSHEITALDNDLAFHAAESGLLMGTSWLVSQNPPPAYDITDLFGSDKPQVNDYTVSVSISVNGQAYEVRSTALCSNRLGYNKTISWTATPELPPNVGTFINSIGIGGSENGTTGFNNMIFDGPFHMNESIIISSVSNPTAGGAGVKWVNGPVTVHNDKSYGSETDDRFKKQDPYTTGDWGEFGDGAFNNYDFGIFEFALDNKQGTDQGDLFDAYLTNSYKHSQNRRYLQDVVYNDTIMLNPSIVKSTVKDERPTLMFNADGTADYYYWTEGATTATHRPLGTINNKLLKASNDINVLGQVNGKVTLESDYSIFPVGDIKYTGFSPSTEGEYTNYDNTNNYGIPGSESILALVAEQNITFVPEWIKPDGTTETVQPQSGEYVYLTAALIAKNGTHHWPLGGRRANEYSKNDYNYKLRAIGSRTVNTWEAPYFASGTTRSAYFYFDTRFLTGLEAPGVPLVLQDDGGKPKWIPILTNWNETNSKPSS